MRKVSHVIAGNILIVAIEGFPKLRPCCVIMYAVFICPFVAERELLAVLVGIPHPLKEEDKSKMHTNSSLRTKSTIIFLVFAVKYQLNWKLSPDVHG